uniref:Uncharacterized protein n=1 Tax=Glossina palpalis gambiensis TaxID=67801 RepID=A0A1B0BWL4_9MUSC
MNKIDDKETKKKKKKQTLKYICNKVICLDGVKVDKIKDTGVRMCMENSNKDLMMSKIVTITINKKTSTALNQFVLSLQVKPACLRVDNFIFSRKLYDPE